MLVGFPPKRVHFAENMPTNIGASRSMDSRVTTFRFSHIPPSSKKEKNQHGGGDPDLVHQPLRVLTSRRETKQNLRDVYSMCQRKKKHGSRWWVRAFVLIVNRAVGNTIHLSDADWLINLHNGRDMQRMGPTLIIAIRGTNCPGVPWVMISGRKNGAFDVSINPILGCARIWNRST